MHISSSPRLLRRKTWATLIATFILAFLNIPTCATWAQSAHPNSKTSMEALVPVVTASAATRDVPIYLKGIGTAVASKTTVVRSRIQGKLSTINFIAGQQVLVGDILARLDSHAYQAHLDQYIAIRDRDQALLANTVATLIPKSGLSSAAKTSLNLVDAQRVQIHQLKGAIENDEARVARARIKLASTELRSPASGVAGKPLHRVGDIIAPAGENGLVVISQIEPISVVFTLPEITLRVIQRQLVDGPAEVRVYSDDKVHPLAEGRLVLGYNGKPQKTGKGELEAMFPNKDHTLSPGMHVEVLVRGTFKRAALTIPLAAVRQSTAGYYTYIVTESRTAHVRPITLGTNTDGAVVVRDGLSPGEVVVIDGQYQLTEGSHVVVVEGPVPERPPSEARAE